MEKRTDDVRKQIYQEVRIMAIGKCPRQPRKKFEGAKFDELCKSVKEKGVLEPILVRPLAERLGKDWMEEHKDFPTYGLPIEFELVAGERRYRAAWAAAQCNGGVELATIPAMVRELTDDEAFDIMTIENLHREDLTELEEAQNFKAYLSRHADDPGRLEALAERTGINHRYIRRRVRVLSLPAPVLQAWEKGELSYGYLEQLNRLEDEKEIMGIFKQIGPCSWRYRTVKELKEEIDDRAPELRWARFNIDQAGCLSCGRNSDVQAELFDTEKMKGTHCLDAKCFKQKQNNWFTANWKKTGFYKQHGTTGFRFEENLDYGKFEQWFGGKPGKKCRECKDFVTRLKLSGESDYPFVCIGDKSCFNATKKKNNHENTKGKKREEEDDQPRVAWHGEYFREKFFSEQIPLRLQTVQPNDVEALQIMLFALIERHAALQDWFARKHKDVVARFDKDPDDDFEEDEEAGPAETWEGYRYFRPGVILQAIQHLTKEKLLDDLKEASMLVLLGNASPVDRRLTADRLGIDLRKEWRITKEYLDKKTTAEIHAIAEEFKLWERKEAQAFLFETLNKKRGKFKSCKKDELVRIILESGMDLAGVVPKEILGE